MPEREPSHLNTPPEVAPADASAETLPPTPAINAGEVPPTPRSKFENEPKYVALSINSLRAKLREMKNGDDLEAYENYAHELFKQNKQSETIGFHVFELGKSTTDSTGKKKHGLKYLSWPKIQGLFQDRLADIILEKGSGTQATEREKTPDDDDIVYDDPAPTITEVPPAPADEHLPPAPEASIPDETPALAAENMAANTPPVQAEQTPDAEAVKFESLVSHADTHFKFWGVLRDSKGVDDPYVGFLSGRDLAERFQLVSRRLEVIEVLPYAFGIREKAREILEKLNTTPLSNQDPVVENTVAEASPEASTNEQVLTTESISKAGSLHELAKILAYSEGVRSQNAGTLSADELVERLKAVENQGILIESLPQEFGIQEKARELLSAEKIPFYSIHGFEDHTDAGQDEQVDGDLEQDQNIPTTEENSVPAVSASTQEKIKMHYSGDDDDNEGERYDDKTWTNTGYGKDDSILKIIKEEDLVHANSTPKSNGAGGGGGGDGIMYKLVKGTRKFFSGLWKGIRVSLGFAKGVSDEISATRAVDKNKRNS